MAGGMHGGACMVEGEHGREHAWQGVHGRGACMAGEMATAADGMHPIGMLSININSLRRRPVSEKDLVKYEIY